MQYIVYMYTTQFASTIPILTLAVIVQSSQHML